MGGIMGGGAPEIPQRNLSGELSQLFGKGGFQRDLKVFNNFRSHEPLLAASNEFALNNLTNVNQLIDPLQSLLGQLPGQFAGYQGQLGGLQGQLGGLQNQLGGYKNRVNSLLQGLPNVKQLTNPLQHLIGTQTGVYNSLQPTLNSQGALNAEQQRNVDQATRAAFAARGNVMGNQSLGAELLNRDTYRQQRFGNALQQALGLSGSIGGLTGQIGGLQAQDVGLRSGLLNQLTGITGQQAGLTGQQAGLVGQQAGLTGQQAGLTSGLSSGIQGLQGGALQQAMGTEQGSIGSFASLMNPLLAYGQDVNSSNQNAAASQAIAGANKSSGAAGGAMSAISTIAPMLMMAFSDKRLKTNVRDTGEETPEGIPIKTFKYRGDKRRFKGVIAQDVEKVRPDAVLTLPVTGHKLVNIGALPGVTFEELKRYLPKEARHGG